VCSLFLSLSLSLSLSFCLSIFQAYLALSLSLAHLLAAFLLIQLLSHCRCCRCRHRCCCCCCCRRRRRRCRRRCCRRRFASDDTLCARLVPDVDGRLVYAMCLFELMACPTAAFRAAAFWADFPHALFSFLINVITIEFANPVSKLLLVRIAACYSLWVQEKRLPVIVNTSGAKQLYSVHPWIVV